MCEIIINPLTSKIILPYKLYDFTVHVLFKVLYDDGEVEKVVMEKEC